MAALWSIAAATRHSVAAATMATILFRTHHMKPLGRAGKPWVEEWKIFNGMKPAVLQERRGKAYKGQENQAYSV